MSALGSLVVKLGLEYAEYTGGLSKTEQAALATAKKVQDTFDGMGRKIAATAGSIAGGLAAGFAIGAFKNLLAGVVETGARLDDLRMQTGETVEALSGLLAVGKYNDVGADQLGAMMQKLSVNLAGATEESKGTAKALQALGIDMDAFKRQSPAEQMQEIARGLDKFEDGAGKSAVAVALLGKEGANALPFFNDLATVGELQAKVTTEQAAAAANLDDNIARLSSTGDAWKKELVTGMVPALDLGAQALLDVMNGTGGMREEVRRLAADGSIREWTKAGITGLTYLADGVEYVIRLLRVGGDSIGAYAAAAHVSMGSVAEAVTRMMRGDFAGAVSVVRSGMSNAGTIINDLGSGIQKVFGADTMGARIRARMGEIEATGQVAEAAKPKLDFSNIVEKNAKAAKEARDPVLALIDSIDKRAALLSLEREGEEKLTEGQKLAIDVLEQLRSGKVKVTEAEAELIGKRLESLLALENQIALEAEENKVREAARADRAKLVQAMEQSAGALLQSNDEMEREIELIGLTQREQVAVLRARNETIILTKQATLAELERRDAITGTMSREQIALAAEIEQLKRRNDLLGKKQQREDEFNSWKSMWESIDSTSHDVFVNIFEDGAGTFKRLGQTLKAALLDWLYQMTMKQWIINISASFGGSMGTGLAAAASGGSNMLGASNVASLFGAGGIGGSLMAGAGWLTGATTFGGALGAGASLIGTGTMAGAMSGIGMIAGALGPIALGVAALTSLIGSLDDSGTPHAGAGAVYAGGSVTGGRDVYSYDRFDLADMNTYSDQVQGLVSPVAQSIGAALDAFATAFGQQAGYTVSTAFADDSSKDASWGALRIEDALGQVLVDWNETRQSKWAPREFADGEEGQKEYLAAIARGTRDALKTALGDATWAKDMLDTLGDSVTLEGLGTVVAQINQAKASFISFGQYMPTFAGLAESAVSALVRASGGVAPLQANMGTFVDLFYSDAEKLAINTENVRTAMRALGLEMPATHDEFKALVQEQIALGEAGAETAASLLGLSGAFAAVTQSSEDAAAAQEALARAETDARRAATDRAWDAMQRSIDAAREAAQAEIELREQRLAAVRTVLDISRTQTRELRGQVAGTAAMAAAQARSFIDQAVAAARAGQGLPDGQRWSDAIAAVRGSIDPGAYGSRKDWEAAQLILANKVEAVGDVGQKQATLEEQALEQSKSAVDRLDAMLKAGRDALDEARGTKVAVLGVETAVREFYARMFEEATGEGGGAAVAGSGGFVSGPGGGAAGSTYDRDANIRQHIDQQLQFAAERGLGHDDKSTLQHINAALFGSGISNADIARVYGMPEDYIDELFAGAGIPRFADGGGHIGGLRLVGEYGPELEVTGPARIYSARQTQQLLAGALGGGGGDSGAMVAALRDLMRQQYDLLRPVIVRLDQLETLARKQDAIGVKQRKAVA